MGNILDQPGGGDLILAETVDRAGLTDGDNLRMGVGNGNRVIEVDNEMAVRGDLVNQFVQRTVLNDRSLVNDNDPPAQLLDIA